MPELVADQAQAFAEYGLVGVQRIREHAHMFGFGGAFTGFHRDFLDLGDAELPPAGLAHVRAGRNQRVQQQFDVAAVEDVVIVGERDVIAVRRIQSGVLRLRDATIRLVDNAHAIVSPLVFVQNHRAGIGGAVVHEDDLQMLVRLPKNRIHAVTQVFLGVVHRNDDRDKRRNLRHGESFFTCLRPAVVAGRPLCLCGHEQYVTG